MSLYDRSKSEVEDLHQCLLDWCRGRVTDNVSAWERIKQSWAEGFRLADEEGLLEGSKHLLALQVRFNESVDDPLKAVWIEGFTGYDVGEDLFQAYYEEWRRRESGEERGRAWSVLLRDGGEGPHRLQWVHAHRSWLADDAFPSFRPPEAIDAGPAATDLDDADEPDDVPWARHEAPEPAIDVEPFAVAADVPPLTEIRAFFGDPDAQAIVGSAPPVFDQHNTEVWLRELRKGGPDAVLRAGLVVLAHLLEPWDRFFPQEPGPRAIYDALARSLAGDATGVEEAQALAPAALETAAAAKEFVPDEPLPDGFEAYAHKTNAAEAAARLAEGAGGLAVKQAVKLFPILEALSEPTRLALRAEVLKAFADVE